MATQHSKKDVVRLNKPVKIRFQDGDELIIRIVEQKIGPRLKVSEELLINSKAPIAQAILGHRAGEEIEFTVVESTQKIIIVKIK